MKIKLLAIALTGLILSACTSGPIHASKMEDMVNSYGAAIRWGEFERAQEFQPPGKRIRLDLDWLRTVHVSSYEVTYKTENPDTRQKEQTVKIRYYMENQGIEKIIYDHQIWRFDEDNDKMVLESDLPVFQ